MMEPEELGLGLTLLRDVRHWTQAELAVAAGVPASALSNYERGETTPSPRTLERLLRALGFGAAGLDLAVAFVRALRSDECRMKAQTGFALALEPLLEAKLLPRLPAPTGAPDPADSARAPGLLARLLPYPATIRQALVLESEDLRSWALCELLCQESAKAAARSGAGALELAELALFVAELLVLDDELFLSCLQGYAWAFVGNARRVQGDLPGADEALACFRRLWGTGAGAAGLLDAARPLDLEASLRRDQRRLEEALDLLEDALDLSGSAEARGRILVKKAKTLEELGRYEDSAESLREAAFLSPGLEDPRLILCIRFNLVVTLCGLERYADAEAFLPEATSLAVTLGNELDLVRLFWLRAKIEAGLGRLKEAEKGYRGGGGGVRKAGHRLRRGLGAAGAGRAAGRAGPQRRREGAGRPGGAALQAPGRGPGDAREPEAARRGGREGCRDGGAGEAAAGGSGGAGGGGQGREMTEECGASLFLSPPYYVRLPRQIGVDGFGT